MVEATLDAIPPVSGGRRGRPKRRPRKLHADKAYAGRPVRQSLRRRHIAPRIPRPGVDSSAKLGRHRWVVERTFAWMARFRRLAVRHDRRADIHLAFTTLAAAPICLNQIRRFCWAYLTSMVRPECPIEKGASSAAPPALGHPVLMIHSGVGVPPV